MFSVITAMNKCHYARNYQKPRVCDTKYFKEQMLLAMKDEAGSNLNNEENDFMLDTSYGEETMEELTAAVMLMAQIQPADGNAETVPSYRYKGTQNIIFDDPYVENNGGTSEHDLNAHDEFHNIQLLTYNVQSEAKNKKRLNNELKKQQELLQKELETFKDQLAKKAFKERENRYLDDIVDLEEKLSSHGRIVYKMGQSIQTIHMLGKEPNKVYYHFLKAGLGYKNPKRLKKAIAAQTKIYHGEMLYSTNLKIDTPDSEETLEDAKESRLKMRKKIVQLDYGKLHALYETFVPQQEPSVKQTYFSVPSTSNHSSETKETTSDLPIQQMPKEKLQQELIDEVHEMMNIFESMEQKVKNEMLSNELEESSSDSKDIQANLLKKIKILEYNFKRSQAQSIDFEFKLQHQKEKMACDVSWKSRLSTLNDENVFLKTQVDSVVKERENVKLEYQKLFNSLKATRTEHQKELDELIEHVNRKTYAYVDVRV
ncbi:hypothetical protein Tco_0959639 [Tanacetum coccineum]